MTETLHLGLPFIEDSQAQKHVTHNEALRMLDATIQIAVEDMTRTAPPASPAEGQRHVVASGASGDWAGRAAAIATWQGGAWTFVAPQTGWRAWSAADASMVVFDGVAWRPLANPVGLLGVNTTAAAPNLLSVRSNAALLAAIPAADGGSGDARLQISKATAGNAASVVFSDAYSGRAEFGLTGDDHFHLKVSADGASWQDAVVIDKTTANVAFHGFSDAAATRASLGLTKQSSAFDATAGRVMTTGAFGWGGDGASATDLNNATVPGIYATDPATTHQPSPSGYYNVLVMRLGGTRVSQLAMQGGASESNACFVRGSTDGGATWSAWTALHAS